MKRCSLICLCIYLLSSALVHAQSAYSGKFMEQYRPQIHFSPPNNWMNDPNGMVYSNGIYHLFYQHYPNATVWGPMHWGHATSKDLVHWQHQPIALYPDSLGYIFSGSVVWDRHNTSGFGKKGKAPLVAIFTHHDPKGEKAGRNDFQNQSLAYSVDEGKSWIKYSGNPVLKNPGIRDFRDPKVSWYEEGKKWIMTLATQDQISFFSSPNLKEWTLESEFGKEVGAHGGVWECPDLFSFEEKGKKIWILVVNLNPGGPNGGSATQYFVGDFDGKTFTPFTKETKWLDYGPDEYAGVTWSNTGKRKIFLGWMSNWQYATLVPTGVWRSAMTVPRELGLQNLRGQYFLTSHPVSELNTLNKNGFALKNITASEKTLTGTIGKLSGPARLTFTTGQLRSFHITLSNQIGEKLVIGYDSTMNHYYIDRTGSGNVSFEKGFAKKHTAPRIAKAQGCDLTLIIDQASVELFSDGGLTVMTEIFFPQAPFSTITLEGSDDFRIQSFQFHNLGSIWRK